MTDKTPPRRYDPSNFSAHDQNRNLVSLDKLTHEELLQVACEAIQTLEVIDAQSHAIAQLIDSWRRGENPALEVDFDS